MGTEKGTSKDEGIARNQSPQKCGSLGSSSSAFRSISILTEIGGMTPTSCKGIRMNAEPTELSVF